MDKLFKSFIDMQDVTNNIAASILATVLVAIAIFFKNLPAKVLRSYYEKRTERAIIQSARMRNITSRLKAETGAIYVHIIKYADTNKPITTKTLLKMSVIWEETGELCQDCAINRLKHEGKHTVRKVQEMWQDRIVNSDWLGIVIQTVGRKHEVTTITADELESTNRSIWEGLHIVTFKEIYLKSFSTSFYTLGLSFCKSAKINGTTNGYIAVAAEELKHLL